MSSTSSRSRTPPSPDRPVIQTHRRYAFLPAQVNLYEQFIEHVEYVVSADGSEMLEHVWAKRYLGTVTKRTKDYIEKKGANP